MMPRSTTRKSRDFGVRDLRPARPMVVLSGSPRCHPDRRVAAIASAVSHIARVSWRMPHAVAPGLCGRNCSCGMVSGGPHPSCRARRSSTHPAKGRQGQRAMPAASHCASLHRHSRTSRRRRATRDQALLDACAWLTFRCHRQKQQPSRQERPDDR